MIRLVVSDGILRCCLDLQLIASLIAVAILPTIETKLRAYTAFSLVADANAQGVPLSSASLGTFTYTPTSPGAGTPEHLS